MIESIVRSVAKKLGSLCRARQFSSPGSILHFYKSTVRPCIEYCCHICSGAPAIYLESLDIHERRIISIICPDLASWIQSLSHHRKVASLCLFYKHFHGNCSGELFVRVPRLYKFKRSTRLATRFYN